MTRNIFKGKLAIAAAITAACVVAPCVASATILPPFGSDLSATPSLDTANGATAANGNTSVKPPTITPAPHDAADAVFWNTTIPGGSNTAPAGGQVLQIKVKGCAIEDTTAPSQLSQGAPVNTINFQVVTPTPNIGPGTVATANIAPYLQMPFCSNSADPTTGAISTSTVTTYEPVHTCISPGQEVAFYDIGGFISDSSGHYWYPQGVPFDVIAPVKGAAMNSFVDAIGQTEYAPGVTTTDPNPATAGFGAEANQEVMLQVIMGTGDDAYGLCPGGKANEPPTGSNQIICVYDHYPTNGAQPCPGWAPPAGGSSGGGGTTGSGGGSTIKPGRPALTAGGFTGVAHKHSVLKFTVTAGSNTGGVKQLTVPLPSGFAFAKLMATLTKGIAINDGAGKLTFSALLSKGVLVLTLASPSPVATVTVSSPALTCSSVEAKKVRLRHVQHIRVTATVKEANGTSKTLTFRAPAH